MISPAIGLFGSAALVVAVLLPPPSAARAPASNAAVAARIAEQLGCQVFAYSPGSNSVSASKGQLDCHLGRQDFVVYVFSSDRDRDKGVAHVKLWSGPDAVYYLASDRRAVIAPRGDFPKPPYTKKWATIAADRTGGAVFSG